MMDKILCIPPERIGDFWPAVLPMIEAAYREVDEFLPSDMLDGLKAGKLLLWISAPEGEILAALVTALLLRPSGLCCKLMACGGKNMKTWVNGHQQIEAYARAEGCGKVFCDGRPGWARALPGYETVRVVLEKGLG